MVQLFGPAKWVAAAPGRVNLIGEHVDYNDGLVLPFAIDRYTAIAARPAADLSGNKARIFSLEKQSMQEIPVAERPRPVPGSWANYVAGVIAGFLDLGIGIPPFDAVIHSRVPVGSGLSSSAALEVATALLLEKMTSVSLDWKARALLCQRAEHEFAGVPCGLMDQIASICGRPGHAMLIDCANNTVEWLPLSLPDVRFYLVDSRVRHDLAESHYSARRSECRQVLELLGKSGFREVSLHDLARIRDMGEEKEKEILFRRGQHVLTETNRVRLAADCLKYGHYQQLAGLMAESHASMKDDFQISCPEIDALVDACHSISGNPPIGSRMTGGGFGGCTINLVPESLVPDFLRGIAKAECNGYPVNAVPFEIMPSGGASALEIGQM